MFKLSIIPVLVIFTGHSDQKINIDSFRGPEKLAYGTYTEKWDGKGHKTSVFDIISCDDPNDRISIKQTKVIDSKAFPIREEEIIVTITGGAHPVRTEVNLKVRYDDSGAAILSRYETKDKQKTVYTERSSPPPSGYSRADPSDLWFSKVIPQPGTTVTSTVFDIEHPGWRIVETTYVRRKWITVGGRQIEAHEIRDVRDGVVHMVYLDDHGQPVLMKNGDMRTEKRF